MHFFDAAANQHLLGAKSRVFPNEILTTIMQFTDAQSSHTLAKVSACWRDMICRRFPLDDHFSVVEVDPDGQSLVLENAHTGQRISSALDHLYKQSKNGWPRRPADKSEIVINPIIGIANPKRQSILDLVNLRLQNVELQEPPYENKVKLPRQ